MTETNDLNNNLEIKTLNLLMEEYLETRQDTREQLTPQSSRQNNAVRYSVSKHHHSARQDPEYPSNSWQMNFYS